MRRMLLAGTIGLGLTALATGLPAGEGVTCTGCTGERCVPRCVASWKEEKTKQPSYEIRCEYAAARGRDSWHAPDPDSRCRPPGGQAYVKKRLYKAEGDETVERVPRYDVIVEPAPAGGCAACAGGRRTAGDPLGIRSWWPRW